MMPDLDTRKTIRPDQVHVLVPGDILAEGSAGRNHHRRVFFRDYRFQPMRVAIPAIEDLLIIVFGNGPRLMRRRFGKEWQCQYVSAGDVSILGSGHASEWEWFDQIIDTHIYLSKEFMTGTAASEFGIDYKKLETIDVLNTADHTLRHLGQMLAQELRTTGDGRNLLVDSLASALSVQLIRRHHRNCDVSGSISGNARLTTVQKARVTEFINANLSNTIGLQELGKVAGLSEPQLLRNFKNTFGESPYQYVLNQRARLAVEKIRQTDLTFAEIASSTGYADQAHMTRAIRKATGQTPGALRRA